MKQKSHRVRAKQTRAKTKRCSGAAIQTLLTAEVVRAIVREEVKCATSVLLEALLITQGPFRLKREWIDLVMDENTSLHRLYFGPRRSTADATAPEPNPWRPISELPCGTPALLRRNELQAVGGYGPQGGFITAQDGRRLSWQPTEFRLLDVPSGATA